MMGISGPRLDCMARGVGNVKREEIGHAASGAGGRESETEDEKGKTGDVIGLRADAGKEETDLCDDPITFLH